MTTQLSNHIRGILKVFGLVVGMARGRYLCRAGRDPRGGSARGGRDRAADVQVWRELKDQITRFDKAVRQEVRQRAECRLLMSAPGIGALSGVGYVSVSSNRSAFAGSAKSELLVLTRREQQVRWTGAAASPNAATFGASVPVRGRRCLADPGATLVAAQSLGRAAGARSGFNKGWVATLLHNLRRHPACDLADR